MFNFDEDGKPDYDTWLKMKEMEEGSHPLSELWNAVNKTVDAQYDGIDPIEFGKRMYGTGRNT